MSNQSASTSTSSSKTYYLFITIDSSYHSIYSAELIKKSSNMKELKKIQKKLSSLVGNELTHKIYLNSCEILELSKDESPYLKLTKEEIGYGTEIIEVVGFNKKQIDNLEENDSLETDIEGDFTDEEFSYNIIDLDGDLSSYSMFDKVNDIIGEC